MEPDPYQVRRNRMNMTPADESTDTRLLTPAEVAAAFRVDTKTVTRWAQAGRLTSIRTLGGHRRFQESEVRALLAASQVRRGVPSQQGPDRG
jgi:excisionase family DNA binding protein